MEIVNEYGSDALRLYLIGSNASKAESLKFSKSGVFAVVKDIIIPLTNTIVFWKEYMELYMNTHKINSNPVIPIKNLIQKISNPINLWILRKYSELRDKFNWHMNQYNLSGATNILNKLVEIMNNGYIKMGRQLIKGKVSQEEWICSLSVLSYVIGFILDDFKSIMPFFCESQYQSLKKFFVDKLGSTNCFDMSIHLIEKQDFIKLSPEQIEKSFDFDIIYNIIGQIYQLRSLNNISLKKPISQVILIWDIELEINYSSRFKEFIGMIQDETNTLDIKILKKSDVNINKKIEPIKSMFFKTYGKEISSTFEQINRMDSSQLENIIDTGNFTGYKIETTFFNYNYNVELSNSQIASKDIVYREFDFGEHKNKIIILMDKSWTEKNQQIYYYRLVAMSIQKSRKNAGLHPWDEIIVLWEGMPQYTLESTDALDYIENITRVQLKNYIGYVDLNKKIIYSNKFENIGITLHLAK
jgi:isoleucyl-tRNA synthetase